MPLPGNTTFSDSRFIFWAFGIPIERRQLFILIYIKKIFLPGRNKTIFRKESMNIRITTGSVVQQCVLRALDKKVPCAVLGRTNLGNGLIEIYFIVIQFSLAPKSEFRCSCIHSTGNDPDKYVVVWHIIIISDN